MTQSFTEAVNWYRRAADQGDVRAELGLGLATRLGVPGGSLLIYDLQLVNVMPAVLPPSAAAR